MKKDAMAEIRRAVCGFGLWTTLGLAGCTGTIAGTGSSGSPSDGDSKAGGGRGGTSSSGTGGSFSTTSTSPSASPSSYTFSAELRRLTRPEYANTVFDLLGVDLSTDERPKELIIRGHSQIAGAQKVGYEDNALFLSLGDKAATSSASKLEAEMKCADAACYRKWTAGFLLRAFREPPAATLVDRYASILSEAEAGTTPVARVSTFLAAVLSSPNFLYRKEFGKTTVSADTSGKEMNAYHVASRLSYLVWQSMPDDQLLGAAEKRTLLNPVQRKLEVERMLKDKRAQRGLRAFVADWMGLFDNNLGRKAAAVLMGTGADLPQVAARAFDLLVDDVLTASAAPHFSDLLKTDQAFANAALGSVLGVQTAGTELLKLTLPTANRVGILTHPMVIGAHSKESGASPFPIGRFIYENLLCLEIPPPPASVPTVEDSPSGQTLRQKLESITKDQPCASCHTRIGPPGFAFLPFDPIGRFRNADGKGQAFDTGGSLVFEDGAPMPFTSAADLSTKLAERPEIQKCIARRMFRWAYGRFESDTDNVALSALEKAAVDSRTGVAESLQQLVTTSSFTQVRVR